MLTTTRRRLRRLLPALGLAVLLAACTPTELKAWLDVHGIDQTGWTQTDYERGAEWATQFWQQYITVLSQHQATDKYAGVLSDEQLYRLRQCESNGNYQIVGGGGAYRGAYQFSQSTWNSIARVDHPNLVGVDPAAASPADQDAMARALYAHQGRAPWPVCGSRL